MLTRASFVAALIGFAFAAQAQGPTPIQPVQQLVRDVVYNEMQDRGSDSFWEYRSARVAGAQNLVREQVETSNGPIFRVLTDHGTPLSPTERDREEARIDDLVKRPGAMDNVEKSHLQDEARMRKIMEMLPDAFLYEYQGNPQGDVVKLAFKPNPSFVPQGYEARILHTLAGTLTVNQRQKRLINMKGTGTERVDFGYGILGHVEKGGTFEIGREQVSDTHWKTDLVEVHVEGKILLLKNVTHDQRESRSDFHAVPHDISLAAAKQLLDTAAESTNVAQAGGSTRRVAP
ncbi:hypothetical protein [Silvibacterium acidisoli]|uniref:hypothetical protein n=1 Tax=Acidobacteriaceae bacterium ZG23-2 TaxID=2883246 RepID=UPI00406C3DFE